jgi:hypothetical protein
MSSSTLISTQCIELFCNGFAAQQRSSFIWKYGKTRTVRITDNMVSSKRGHMHNYDNRILGHPRRVQSTASIKQFGPVQKTHGRSPTVISACSLQSEFLIQVMFRRSISMKLTASTAQILPFSRFLDLVSRNTMGFFRRVIYRSQGNVKR